MLLLCLLLLLLMIQKRSLLLLAQSCRRRECTGHSVFQTGLPRRRGSAEKLSKLEQSLCCTRVERQLGRASSACILRRCATAAGAVLGSRSGRAVA